MKRILSIIIALSMAFTVFGCGGAGNDSGTGVGSPVSGEVGVHNIGVLVYSVGDEQVISFKEYLQDYISSVFPDVKFIYSDAIQSSEQQNQVMQDMMDAGVEGFFAFNHYDVATEVKMCSERGVYYLIPSGTISDEEFNAVKDNPYFLGVVGPGREMEYEAGYDMADFFCDGTDDGGYFILSGGAAMNNEMHILRTLGILDALQTNHKVSLGSESEIEAAVRKNEPAHFEAGDLKVCVMPGYLDIDLFLDPAREEYAKHNYKVMLGVVPVGEMATDAAKADAKLGVVDSFTTRNLQLVNQGTMSYVAGKYCSILGPSFAAMYNAVTGHAGEFREADGSAFKLEQGFWTAKDKSSFNEMYALAYGIAVNAYNYEDIEGVCKEFNPDATLEDLKELALAYSYEDALTRRSID